MSDGGPAMSCPRDPITVAVAMGLGTEVATPLHTNERFIYAIGFKPAFDLERVPKSGGAFEKVLPLVAVLPHGVRRVILSH